ncbi:MAG TPA: PDR/VanB family oxidoreductase [Xanthobacteraceae bacterium]|nr:PDR/VanB family oxidoreductase [Xanthobacteraceae bacterium]
MAGLEIPSLPLRISRASAETPDIRLFELTAADGAELPQFSPGAHISVRAPNGMIRKYSLCNDPAERERYIIAVLREPGGRGGSLSLVDEINEGDDILATPPRNDFPLVPSPAGYTFIAGGIGITPILSMMRHLKSSAGPKFKLYYCTRSKEKTAFYQQLSGPEFRGQVVMHHDGGDLDKALDLWPVLENPRGQVYCCGPRGLMDSVRDMTGHWNASAVHFEAFSDAEAHKPNDRPFRVKLARSGGAVEVPAEKTILESIRAAGHEAPSSCESGTCGTCKTKLLAGEADHRDLVLTDGERNDHIMICVSRAKSDELTIDR